MPENQPSTDLGRRDFLRTGMRWAVAGSLVGGMILVNRKGANGACRQASPCGACPVLLDGCGLPKAVEWRQATPDRKEDA